MNSDTMFVVAPFVLMGVCAIASYRVVGLAMRRAWPETRQTIVPVALLSAALLFILLFRAFSPWTMLIPYSVGAAGAWWALRQDSPRSTWVPMSVVALVSMGFGVGYQLLNLPARIGDELQREARSPDSRYSATSWIQRRLLYGYQHVDLQLVGWSLPPNRTVHIAAIAYGEITNLTWSGPRTLVVEYKGPKHRDKSENTDFVGSLDKWDDVQIIYRPQIENQVK